jgi:hypothetical protein
MTIGALALTFLVYWLVVFVTSYIVVEFGQNYLYDETTPGMGLKVATGSLLLAAMLTWTRTSFDTMLTSDAGQTVLQAIAWFAVFTLVYRFQPLHGGVIGIVAMLIVAGLATLAADSLTSPSRAVVREVRPPSPPIRRPVGSPMTSDRPPNAAAEPAKSPSP